MSIKDLIKLVDNELKKCKPGKVKHESLLSIKKGLLETGTCYVAKNRMKDYNIRLKDALIENAGSIESLNRGCMYDFTNLHSKNKFEFKIELRPALK